MIEEQKFEYFWEEIQQPTEEEQKLCARLGLPAKTLHIIEKALYLKLPKSMTWNIREISDPKPFISAAKLYKRGVPLISSCLSPRNNTNPSLLAFLPKYCSQVILDVENFTVVDKNILSFFPSLFEKFSPDKLCPIEASEKYKTLETVASILDRWKIAGRPKHWQIIGGGTLSDIAGFAASLAQITFSLYPTTLLAMIDASLGGKNGVNLPPFGKNLIGSIYFAKKTALWPGWLSTLSREEFLSGACEGIKHLLIAGTKKEFQQFTKLLREEKYHEIDNWLLRLSQIKTHIVEQDPYEKNLRHVLNLGHTLGHALEAKSLSLLPHGHAVCLGMIFSFLLSVELKLMTYDYFLFLFAEIKKTGCLLSFTEIKKIFKETLQEEDFAAELLSLIKQDKKRSSLVSDKTNWVLLREVGKIFVSGKSYLIEVSDKTFLKVWRRFLDLLCQYFLTHEDKNRQPAYSE